MATKEIRILGLTLQPVANFRAEPHAKSTGLYAALDRRFNVVGVVQPELPPVEDYFNRLRHIHPDRVEWRARIDLDPWAFKRRTVVAERQLQNWHGQYDLIMQLHTLVAPGFLSPDRVYVLHTDNTYILSERYYPKWAPLHGEQRNEWIALEQKTYQQAAFLFPRSEFLRRSLIDDYGCDPDRVIRVGGGANLAASSLEGKRYDSQVALFVGGDFERKGGETLLAAWEIVHRKLPDAQLWLVGPKHKVGAANQGLHWFGKIADRQVLADLYKRASIFVMPSDFEPWGHVFLEAMGYGLACIGTDHCAMPEIIENGATGRLVPPADSESLAAELIALLGNPDEAERMGRRAYQHVLMGHTWDDVVDRMVPHIETVASNSRYAGSALHL